MAQFLKFAATGTCLLSAGLFIYSLGESSAAQQTSPSASNSPNRQTTDRAAQNASQSPIPANVSPTLIDLSRNAEKRILQAMQKKIEISLKDEPLKRFMNTLSEKGGFPIVLNVAALNEEGVADDEPLTDELQDVTIELALNWTLHPLGLTWTIENEVVRVTTEVDASELLSARTYDVRALMELHRKDGNKQSAVAPFSRFRQFANRDADAKSKNTLVANAETSTGSLPRNASALTTELLQIGLPNGGGLGGNLALPQSNSEDASWLVELLQNHTPGPWMEIDGTGGTISHLRDTITVTQTWKGQSEVAQLLWSLNAVAAGQATRESIVARPKTYPAEIDRNTRATLLQKSSVKYLKTPLSSVAADIEKRHNIRLRIGTTALAEEGIDVDEPISLSLENVALGSILNLMLEPLGLTYYVDEGALWLTTEIKAEEFLHTAVYDVGDLVIPRTGFDPLIELIQQETSGPWSEIDGTGGSVGEAEPVGALVVRQTHKVHGEIAQRLADLRKTFTAQPKLAPPDKPDPDEIITRVYDLSKTNAAADLLSTIPRFVAPDKWEETNQLIAIQKVGESLVIRQTREMHEQIDRFLQRFGFHTRSAFDSTSN